MQRQKMCLGHIRLAFVLALLLAAGVVPARASESVQLAAMVAGNHHSCALTTTGAVKCWGRNQVGQLGIGTAPTLPSTTPVDVVGLGSGVVAISAHGDHTCALTTAGGVKCWGFNSWGQVGDGTFNNFRAAPVDVINLASGVSAIAAGSEHTCALMTGGGIKCWGLNLFGQVGNGTSGNAWLGPIDVAGLGSGVASISAGGLHTCAVTTAGALTCWGSNFNGQLGIGTVLTSPEADAGPDPAKCTTPTYAGCRATPTDVPGLGSGIAAVSAGAANTCALTTAGSVKCWGYNAWGQVGDGTTSTTPPNWPQPSPVDVIGLGSGVAAVSASGDRPCALMTAGGVKCWGLNDVGQVGDGTTTRRTTPVDVAGLGSQVAGIAAGSRHTCAWLTLTPGGAKCWGWNFYGQLGNGIRAGEFEANPIPVDVLFDVLVRMVYLIPSDRTFDGDYPTAIQNAITDLRIWYRGQMLNHKTFRLHSPIVEVFQTPHQADWYGTNPNGSNFQAWFFNNVIADGFVVTSGMRNDPANIWVFYIDAEPKCEPGPDGRGEQIGGGGESDGLAVLWSNDLRGLAGRQNTTHPCGGDRPIDNRPVSGWIGGLGHELGHALGLCHGPCRPDGSGPCDPLAIAKSNGAVRAANIVTVTTTSPHGLSTQTVTISGVLDSSFNGTFVIATVPSTTTFTYAQTGADATSGGGTVDTSDCTDIMRNSIMVTGYLNYPNTYLISEDLATLDASRFFTFDPAVPVP